MDRDADFTPLPDLSDPHATDVWISAAADRLLNRSMLRVCEANFRLVEIEFYLFDVRHPDPFAHRHPRQNCGDRWYLHRTGDGYRSGSFKGLDLTCGAGGTLGGILIRSLRDDDDRLICGPSLCVDRILSLTKTESVRALDGRIGQLSASGPENPVRVIAANHSEVRTIFRTARVGLSLKRFAADPTTLHYLLKPDRFLTESRRVTKGKPQLILRLNADGLPLERIHELTGSPRRTIERYVQAFDAGRHETDFTPYDRTDLDPLKLCRLHGMVAESR